MVTARRLTRGKREGSRRLVAHGLVDVEDHGSAYAYRCNRDHVMYEAVEAIAGAADRVEERLVKTVAAWDPPAYAVVLYGSFARRDEASDSDLDLLLIRPDDVDEDSDAGFGSVRCSPLMPNAGRATGPRCWSCRPPSWRPPSTRRRRSSHRCVCMRGC